jgi:hypothetical protein
MKTLFKLFVLAVVVLVFCFSQNETISKARNFVYDNGKSIYQKSCDSMSKSDIKPVVETANLLK